MPENRTGFAEKEKPKKDLAPYAAVVVVVLSVAAILSILVWARIS